MNINWPISIECSMINHFHSVTSMINHWNFNGFLEQCTSIFMFYLCSCSSPCLWPWPRLCQSPNHVHIHICVHVRLCPQFYVLVHIHVHVHVNVHQHMDIGNGHWMEIDIPRAIVWYSFVKYVLLLSPIATEYQKSDVTSLSVSLIFGSFFSQSDTWYYQDTEASTTSTHLRSPAYRKVSFEI
jgi:hypothetical protein